MNQLVTFPRIETLEMSNSSCGSLHSCPRKIEFRKFYNNSRRDESYAAGAGTAMHAGIQTYLRTKDVDEAVWAMIKAFPIKWQKSFADPRSLDACYATLINSINWPKLDEYELATVVKPDGEHIPAIEVPFILRIKDFPFYEDGGTITVDYIGYMDLIMYDKYNDQYVVWDIKTTEKDVDQSVQFQFHEQCLPYGLVLETLLGHDGSKGFDVAYWSVRINILEPKNKYYDYSKTPTDIQDWLRGYLLDLQAIRQYVNMGWFPRRGNACMGYNRPCVFFDFCETRDPAVIEMMLREDDQQREQYKHDIWCVVDLNIESVA